MWTRIPREMSILQLIDIIKQSKLTVHNQSYYKKDEVISIFEQIESAITQLNFTHQSCTVLLGLRNDNWALQALADIDGSAYDPKKIEEYLLRTQHLAQHLKTPNLPQVFLSQNEQGSSFLTCEQETMLLTARQLCPHKRNKKLCWSCNACKKCNTKGQCEHRRRAIRPETDKEMSVISSNCSSRK